MDECIKKLHSVRNKRIRPGLDDKIILAWNALMNKAFTKASIVVGNNNYKRIAERNMQFLLSQFSSDNGADLFHTFKNGVAKYPAFLDDYAILIDALIDLYECTFQEQYLHTAFDLTKHVCNAFSDEEDVCFYYTSIHQQDVIVRKKELYDGALPSGNAVMAKNLYKLGTTFHHLQWQDRSINMLQSIYSLAIKYPSSFAVWATAIEQHTYGINEIAFEGVGATENAERFNAGNFLPNKIIVASNNINNNIPFFRNNSPAEVLNIYLCKSRVCLPPLKDEAELLAAIVSNKF